MGTPVVSVSIHGDNDAGRVGQSQRPYRGKAVLDEAAAASEVTTGYKASRKGRRDPSTSVVEEQVISHATVKTANGLHALPAAGPLSGNPL